MSLESPSPTRMAKSFDVDQLLEMRRDDPERFRLLSWEGTDDDLQLRLFPFVTGCGELSPPSSYLQSSDRMMDWRKYTEELQAQSKYTEELLIQWLLLVKLSLSWIRSDRRVMMTKRIIDLWMMMKSETRNNYDEKNKEAEKRVQNPREYIC